MTTDGKLPAVTAEDLSRIEELVRYVASHDGRMPTDDLPLSWWLVDILDEEKDHPVRQTLTGIPVVQVGRNLNPKKAHAWSTWISRYDRLIWAGQRGQSLDDILPKDKMMRDWFNDMLVRHHVGSLGTIESLLLEKASLWDPDLLPDTRSAKQQVTFKIGIDAVREFYLKNKHTDIPEGYTVAGLDIHHWWFVQRGAYSHPNGMKEHLRQQFARLENLGADLRTDKQRAAEDIVFRYRDRMAEIADYIGQHGMSALPEKGKTFVNSARNWIAQYHNGNLDPALQEALESISGWSWGEEDLDLEVYREFASTHGHLDVHQEQSTAYEEDAWVRLRRISQEYWLNPNPPRPVKRAVGQFNDIADTSWERGVSKLAAWCRKYQDQMPEPEAVTASGFRIGIFMKYVYRKADHGLLSRAQLRDLVRASGNDWWLESDVDAYGRTVTVLARFARPHGHCAPLWGDTWGDEDMRRDLAGFVKRVCADREADDLSATEALYLEGLPGWSWSRRERAEKRAKAARVKSAGGRAAAIRQQVKEPKRSVRTDLPDPDSKLNRSGLKQFLPAD